MKKILIILSIMLISINLVNALDIHTCKKPGDIIYQSSSNDSLIDVVSCKSDGNYYLVITNFNTEEIEVTIKTSINNTIWIDEIKNLMYATNLPEWGFKIILPARSVTTLTNFSYDYEEERYFNSITKYDNQNWSFTPNQEEITFDCASEGVHIKTLDGEDIPVKECENERFIYHEYPNNSTNIKIQTDIPNWLKNDLKYKLWKEPEGEVIKYFYMEEIKLSLQRKIAIQRSLGKMLFEQIS